MTVAGWVVYFSLDAMMAFFFSANSTLLVALVKILL